MSSVLKALRQQQSQLIPLQQPVHLTAASSSARSWIGWWWLAVPIALAVGWAGTSWYLTGSFLMPLTTEQVSSSTQSGASEAKLKIGKAQPVRIVELIRDTQMEASAEMQVTNSSFQEPQDIAPDEAVDLDQVPADLLAAFEEAIAATGNATAAQPAQSILPRIAELESSLQQRIPSFTYDGHQYSSRPQERFIELAGQRLRQGDYWQGIQVLTIAPNHVVLVLGNDAFQQPALEDWTTRP